MTLNNVGLLVCCFYFFLDISLCLKCSLFLHPEISWNLRKEFSRPVVHGKSLKSRGIPPVGHGIFNRRIIILGV